MTTPNVLDLNTARQRRREARAAAGEVAEPLVIVIGDGQIGPLPEEIPLEVFAPLEDVDVDLAVLVQEALEAVKSGSQEQATVRLLDMATQLVVMNPKLPKELLAAARQVAVNLLGADGWAVWQSARPSPQDYGALARGLMDRYVTLGESSRSTEPSTGGPISSSTSEPGSDSTPEASGGVLESPASSGSEEPPSTSAVSP